MKTEDDNAALIQNAINAGFSEGGANALLGLDDGALAPWEDFVEAHLTDMRPLVPNLADAPEPIMGLTDETMKVAALVIGRIMVTLAMQFPPLNMFGVIAEIAKQSSSAAIHQAGALDINYSENGEPKTDKLLALMQKVAAERAAAEAAAPAVGNDADADGA